jgi:hypothetical protein
MAVSVSLVTGVRGHLGHADELVHLSATPEGGLPPRVVFLLNKK